METFPIRAAILRGALAGAALAALATLAPQARAEEWTRTYAVTGHAHVSVDTNDGAVRIVTSDSKQVVFRVIYEGYRLDRDMKIDSSQQGDSLQVSARVRSGFSWFGWGSMPRSLRIEVYMPKAADLQVESGDGSVESQAVNGNMTVHTGDGHIRVDGARGDIHLRTGDGGIDAQGLDGRVEAASGDGHVSIEGRFDSLDIKTGDGSVQVHALPGSRLVNPWNVRTGDGSVDVTVPGDLQATIDASTHDGRISLGIPVTVEGTFSTSEIHGKMNGGGQSLTIQTGDGSIHLSRS